MSSVAQFAEPNPNELRRGTTQEGKHVISSARGPSALQTS